MGMETMSQGEDCEAAAFTGTEQLVGFHIMQVAYLGILEDLEKLWRRATCHSVHDLSRRRSLLGIFKK
jgi:hypothetical protein